MKKYRQFLMPLLVLVLLQGCAVFGDAGNNSAMLSSKKTPQKKIRVIIPRVTSEEREMIMKKYEKGESSQGN
jgi:hypothetical protein